MSSASDSAAAINRLADALNRHAFIRQHDKPGEPCSGVLAHALFDLDQSFRKVSGKLLPALIKDAHDAENSRKILLEIGEEIRHVMYHIEQTVFFSYVQGSTS